MAHLPPEGKPGKAAKLVGVADKRRWRVLQHYVCEALQRLDLSSVNAIALDETASKRGQRYAIVLTDMERDERPVLFATPGKGNECLREFVRFLEKHNGSVGNIFAVVCDMSAAFRGDGGKAPERHCTPLDIAVQQRSVGGHERVVPTRQIIC